MQEDFFSLVLKEQEKQQAAKVLEMNPKTEKYGLTLSKEEAGQLIAAKNHTLMQQRRVEFTEGILPGLILIFCDSPYLNRGNYVETIGELQDIFFSYKNESMDLLTDEELLHFMKEQFDGVCYGSTEYLAGTCLERFARAVRAGYRDYMEKEGEGIYEDFSEEQGWDKDLFLAVWDELIQ